MFLTEIKAAAIDVVAEAAAAAGRELVFCDNEPVAVGGTDLRRPRVTALADAEPSALRRGAPEMVDESAFVIIDPQAEPAVQQGPDGAVADGHRPAAGGGLRRWRPPSSARCAAPAIAP